jgi:hypothetical protein
MNRITDRVAIALRSSQEDTMNRHSKLFALTATAVATSLLVAACGGGDASPPSASSAINAGTTAPAPDTKVPSVTIFDDTSAATATGPVTFTFVFSKDVGASFTASDVVVTGGTAGAFTKVSATQATLLVTPTVNAAGAITVSVPVGTFSDLAGNNNTAGATAQQTYNTVVPVVVATGTTLATFDEAVALAFVGFDGGEGSAIEAGPAGGSGKALKILRSGGQVWAGAKVTVAPPAFSATEKTISARVYSPKAGIPIVLKMEGASIASAEIQATETVVAGWQTLTWVVTGIDTTKSYPDITLLPNLGTLAPVAGEIYYIDDIKFSGTPAAGGGASSGALMASFDEAPALAFTGFDGGEGSAIDAAPPAGGGTGKALKILRSGGQVWAGAKVTTAAPLFTATDKTITAKVYSPKAGIPIVLKMEGVSIASAEIQASAPVVAGWQTLSWVVTGIDLTKTYTDVVFLPNLGTLAPVAGETYYVDDIRFSGALAGAGGGGSSGGTPGVGMGAGGPQTLTIASGDVKTGDGGNTMFVAGEGLFAVNFVGSAETTAPFNLAAWLNAKTANFAGITGISGGDIGYFQDDANLSNSSQKVDEGGWVAGTALSPNGVPSFFRYFVLKGPVSNSAYMGVYMNAPNNGTLNVSSFSKIKMKVWGPGPMFNQTNLNPVLEVTLVGPKVAGCTTGSGGSEITQNLTANKKEGAGIFYTLPLSGFTVKSLCGTDSGAASVLAKLARVVVTVPGTSFNYTNLDGGNYATGVNLGPVGFTNN